MMSKYCSLWNYLLYVATEDVLHIIVVRKLIQTCVKYIFGSFKNITFKNEIVMLRFPVAQTDNDRFTH